MSQIVPMQPGAVAAPMGGSMALGLMPANLREAMDLATMMSKGKLVPEALRNSPADCLLVIEQAMRWSMSPFAVAQEVSVISGKLMHSGKIVAAAVQSSGLLQRRLQYEYSGEGDTREVRVIGTLRGETEPRDVTVKFKDVRTSNQQWTKQPDQQLAYSGSRVWGRRHTPEVMLGVWTPEEFDAEERAARRGGATINGQAEAVHSLAPQATREAVVPVLDMPAEQIPAEAGSLREVAERVQQAAPDRQRQAANRLLARIAALGTEEDLEALEADDAVRAGRAKLRPELNAEIEDALAAAFNRVTGQDDPDIMEQPDPAPAGDAAPVPETAEATS